MWCLCRRCVCERPVHFSILCWEETKQHMPVLIKKQPCGSTLRRKSSYSSCLVQAMSTRGKVGGKTLKRNCHSIQPSRCNLESEKRGMSGSCDVKYINKYIYEYTYIYIFLQYFYSVSWKLAHDLSILEKKKCFNIPRNKWGAEWEFPTFVKTYSVYVNHVWPTAKCSHFPSHLETKSEHILYFQEPVIIINTI